jgi:hypothetical protein
MNRLSILVKSVILKSSYSQDEDQNEQNEEEIVNKANDSKCFLWQKIKRK